MHTTLAFLGGVGMQEILVIGMVILVFFGAKKIPDFMKGLGKGVREFKDSVKEIKSDVETSASTETKE
jgi:sec-independent protein translocase protein TatA